MAKRVFLIHGWGSSPQDGWKPWLKRELEKRGLEAYVPQMPDTNTPKMDAWLAKMKEVVGKVDENTFFVGHSLGSVAIPRYLESLAEGEVAGGAVLVAGFSDDLGIPEIKNFFPRPLEWAKIKSQCKKFIAIHSDNDYYVALKYGEEFREKLGAKLIIMHDHFHFSSADGFKKLPVLLESILEVAGEKD
ncbi:Serine hydrolase [uncultured archaeon]|nr:Serine hydrolase [uncultured archaeon]